MSVPLFVRYCARLEAEAFAWKSVAWLPEQYRPAAAAAVRRCRACTQDEAQAAAIETLPDAYLVQLLNEVAADIAARREREPQP